MRHILFMVAQDAPAEERTVKKEAAEQALAMLRGGSKFDEIANSLTEDPAGKGKGGDLGFIARGQMVPQFEAAAFELVAGEISQVVESPFGYHLIKVEAIKPEFNPPFDEKEDEIRGILAQQKVRGITFKKVSSAYEGVMRAGSLEKYSENSEQKLESTDYCSQDAVPQSNSLLQDAAIAKAAFALGKGELSSIVEGAKGYVILFADDVTTPDIPALESIRSRALADFTREKSTELVRKAAEDTLQMLRDKGQWPEAVQVQNTAFIKRTDTGDAAPAPMLQEAFSQLGKDKLPSAPVNLGEDYAVYQIAGVQQGEDTTPEAVRNALKEQILQAERNQLFGQWVTQLRSKSKIWVNPEFLK